MVIIWFDKKTAYFIKGVQSSKLKMARRLCALAWFVMPLHAAATVVSVRPSIGRQPTPSGPTIISNTSSRYGTQHATQFLYYDLHVCGTTLAVGVGYARGLAQL